MSTIPAEKPSTGRLVSSVSCRRSKRLLECVVIGVVEVIVAAGDDNSEGRRIDEEGGWWW